MEQWRIDCVAVVLLALVVILTIGQSAASPPVITVGLNNEAGIEGGTAIFYCKATGDPAPTFQWYRSKKRVRGTRFEIVEMEGGSVLRISPLRIKGGSGDHEHPVMCEATNDDGRATTQARLMVYEGKRQDWDYMVKDLGLTNTKVFDGLKM
ncbi:receptor-type tyrosine-protein phosphatase S-like [Lytechinus pictus]|uniref:receptor-type tyrosine-protein phosphatase S-like n=1 Tax=Lytechinus pictus TaxID=7653 RepID=UPI0030B9F9B0